MMELIEKQVIGAEPTGADARLVTSRTSVAMIMGAAAYKIRDSKLEKFDPRHFERINFDKDWKSIIQELPVTKL